MNDVKRKNVDLLVENFWKRGYLTVSRKYGTYLPEPSKVGIFDVDVVAKLRKDYAIGITLNDKDLKDPDLLKRIKFLATRQTKYTNKKVQLFIGVPAEHFRTVKSLISILNKDERKNIKVVMISERKFHNTAPRNTSQVLFS